jgi:hypothetical protein
MTKDELERLGKFLAKLAEEGKHPKGHDPETCQKFAGIACGVVGRELHEAREIWRSQEAAHWGNPPLFDKNTGQAVIPVPATPAPTPQKRAYAPRKRAATTAAAPRTKTVMFANVDEGFYALPGGTGRYEYFKVDVPKKGRWANYRFIRDYRMDGKFHRIMDRDEATRYLDRISKDTLQAAADFKKHASTMVKTAEMAW